VEDNFARYWRNSLANLDLKRQAEVFRSVGIDGKSCNSLDAAKVLANQFVNQTKPYDQMLLAVHFLGIPREHHQNILDRWQLHNHTPLTKFAPYAAYVLEIELFFQIAIASHLISTDKPSNRVDISYLFYLPFCMIFVSTDKLHSKCAPYFLREDQDFIWGQDLKIDLSNLNKRYKELPQEVTDLGVISFAHSPPHDEKFLTTRLWDRHFSKRWRDGNEISTKLPEKDEKLLKSMKQAGEAPPATGDDIDLDDIDLDDIQSMTLKRMVRKKKGNWLQIHKDIEPGES